MLDNLNEKLQTAYEYGNWTDVIKEIVDEVEKSATEAVWGKITGTLAEQEDLKDALDGKLDAVTSETSYNQAYVKKADGTQTLVNIADIVSANSLALRISGGRLRMGDAVDDEDGSNKRTTKAIANGLFSLVGTDLTITLY